MRAGSLLPLGEDIENTTQPQKIAELRVYPGADGETTIYSDDGHTYDYESGKCETAVLHYHDKDKSVQSSGSNTSLPADLPLHIVGK